MSTRTMDVPMARPITRIATGCASRANSNLSPVPTHKGRPYRQQHLTSIQSLEAAHRPTCDAVFQAPSRPVIAQLHHTGAQAAAAEIRSSLVIRLLLSHTLIAPKVDQSWYIAERQILEWSERRPLGSPTAS
jgi:hypothetical protein